MATDTIPARLFAQAQRRPFEAAYFVKVDGAWRGTRWREFAAEVRRAARALLALGVVRRRWAGLRRRLGGRR